VIFRGRHFSLEKYYITHTFTYIQG